LEPTEQPKLGTNINYFVITAIFIAVLIYSVGNAWGLLLVGFDLNTFGDVRYYFFELFGIFDRSDIATPLWVAGTWLCAMHFTNTEMYNIL